MQLNSILYVWITIIISHHYLTGGVDYKLDDEHKDKDYIPLIFRNGKSTSDPLYINITDHDGFEEHETFSISIDPLSLPYNTILGSNASAIVTIMDNECT